MENIGRKVNELLDKEANDYASENQQHDLSAQYSAFIAGANYVLLELGKTNDIELKNGDCKNKMKDEELKNSEAIPQCFDDCGESEPILSFEEQVINLSKKSEPEIHGVSTEMPKYKCIKDVWALKIKSIVFDSDLANETGRETNGTAIFTPEDDRYTPIELSSEFVHKHKPVAGGYFVVYKDGYKSFSPASAFEEGYVLIP